MTTADQTGELTAGGMLQQQHGDSQGRPIVQERTRTPRAGKTVSGTHHQPGTVPPALRPAGLLQRPGMGRQMSSVSNLIDAYGRNSPKTSTSAWSEMDSSEKRSSTSNRSSAPSSPSVAQPSYSPRTAYHSQIVARRSSVQIPGSPRASTSDSSELVRARRPSAPEIHSPPTRVTAGANGVDANATKAPSTMGSIFDIKRLRSKPALPQQSLPAGQGSSDYNRDTLVSDDQRSLAIVPKEQQGPTSALTTRLPGPDLMLQTSEAMIPSSSAKIQHSSAFLAPLHAGSQAGPSEVPDYNRVQQQASSQDRQIKANDNHFADSVARSPRSYIYSHESSTVGHQWHVDNSSSSIPTQSRHTAVRSRFDSSTRIDDSNLSQQYPTSGSSLIAASPQTPRKVRNSSLPMGISPSASSSPIEGRQSPSSRRPLRPIAPTISSTTSSPYDHSLPLLPNQPSLPPSPRSKASPDGEMYESILPTSSSLRPNCQALPEGIPTTSPPSDSSERVASSERARPSMHGSSARSDMERSAANASSPPSHRKLVRKQSKGHMRRDSGTSGHNKASSSNSTVHSRSLSLPRSGSRGSTPTGSGSGSEQDDTTVAMSSDHSHFLTHRPAWLDQDPNATFPPPHQPNMPSRAKPAQHYPSLYQHHNNRSLTSLSQPPPDLDQDQAFFAPSSLPSTSAFPTQMEAAASPKRKASFYRRKRSQTATAVQGSQVTDSNGFPMPSPLSEIVKNMPLHDRMSHDVLHAPASFPKRSTSAGGFLFSITRKLSHPNLKDQHPNTEASVIPADTIPDYFGGTPAAAKPAQSGSHSLNIDSGPKLGSSFAPRSWRHPFRHNDLSKNEAKALPQLPVGSSALPGDKTIGDPFLASSAMSLSGFLHRSPRKDSLSSDKSEQSNGQRRGTLRSRTISQDGDSSDGHSSEAGFSSLRSHNLAPPVPEVPFGMRNATMGQSLPASTLPKATKKTPGLLRSPSLGHRNKKTVPDLDLSPTTPRASVFNTTPNDGLPSPTRAGMLVIDRANESLTSARRSGLSAALASATTTSDTPAPNVLGSFAARDKITAIENDIKEAKFLALMDKSARAEHGILKLSLASSAAREAGIA